MQSKSTLYMIWELFMPGNCSFGVKYSGNWVTRQLQTTQTHWSCTGERLEHIHCLCVMGTRIVHVSFFDLSKFQYQLSNMCCYIELRVL